MKLFNRIEVRLALLMLLVAVATSVITIALNNYQRERSFRELPPEVRDLLRQGNGRLRLPPLGFPSELRDVLVEGGEVSVRIQPPADPDGPTVFLVRPLGEPLRVIRVEPVGRRRNMNFESQLQQNLIIASLVATLLGGLIALWFARRIARPIEAVSGAAGRLAQGDLSARIPDPKGDDETARLAKSFNHMAESLERLEAGRKAMIADIAHELRTPLTVMQGRLEAIQDGVAPLEMTEIDRLHRQTGLLSRLVEDLRTLSLADAGKLALERRPLDLREVAQRTAQAFQVQAQARNIGLELHLPAAPLKTQADADRLGQVVGNLLANALTHTPEGGRVSLRAWAEGGSVRLEVADTGPGIPPEALPKLFDRFYRAEGSRSRQTGGSGLGLTIVKTLVELHGGAVEARNRPGGGAEFGVSLPAS